MHCLPSHALCAYWIVCYNLFNKMLALWYVKKLFFVFSLPFLSLCLCSLFDFFLFAMITKYLVWADVRGDSWGSFRWWWCCCLVLSVVANALLSTFCRTVLILQLLAHVSTLKLKCLMFKLCLMTLCCAFGFSFSIWIIVIGYFIVLYVNALFCTINMQCSIY